MCIRDRMIPATPATIKRGPRGGDGVPSPLPSQSLPLLERLVRAVLDRLLGPLGRLRAHVAHRVEAVPVPFRVIHLRADRGRRRRGGQPRRGLAEHPLRLLPFPPVSYTHLRAHETK